MKPINTKQFYPWLTSITALVSLCYFALYLNQDIANFYLIPSYIFSIEGQMFAAGSLMLVIMIDLRRFYNRQTAIANQVEQLQRQVKELWESKKSTQQKAHRYSGHADKLKLFISDKLLEYIEYDEKFLHFKNIAAEVRHNGVISYDVVKRALMRAAQLEQEMSKDDKNHERPYQQAIEAMGYLWDLLDLATADNIALHIGNLLCELEEQYYQLMLDEESNQDMLPHFDAFTACLKTLSPLLENPQSGVMLQTQPHPCYFQDSFFILKCEKSSQLLGKENHLVLLLENLIKNALFFSKKVRFKQKTDRIIIDFNEIHNQAVLTVYNRGPIINNAEEIFNLGFSTRKVKEHHGKGLGLFFVGEIVKGYEGQINVENIANIAEQITLRVQLTNGDVHTKTLMTNVDNDRPLIGEADKELAKQFEWSFQKTIKNIEVTSNIDNKTHVFDWQDHIIDEQQPSRWQIQSKPKKIVFTPLDITGVKFSIKLPNVSQRMDNEFDEENTQGKFDGEVERLQDNFKEFDFD